MYGDVYVYGTATAVYGDVYEYGAAAILWSGAQTLLIFTNFEAPMTSLLWPLLSTLAVSLPPCACTCAVSTTFADRIRESELIFVGRPIANSWREIPGVKRGVTVVTFIIEELWKGPRTDTARIEFEGVADCGTNFAEGVPYIIAARAAGNGFRIGVCEESSAETSSPHAHIRARVDSIRKMLGEPTWLAPPVSAGTIATRPMTWV